MRKRGGTIDDDKYVYVYVQKDGVGYFAKRLREESKSAVVQEHHATAPPQDDGYPASPFARQQAAPPQHDGYPASAFARQQASAHQATASHATASHATAPPQHHDDGYPASPFARHQARTHQATASHAKARAHTNAQTMQPKKQENKLQGITKPENPSPGDVGYDSDTDLKLPRRLRSLRDKRYDKEYSSRTKPKKK
jgi:hypothetical protein